ncbi:uncharacterized hydrolase YugF-like isoform X2 [Impatiens glandulifera]|uniref:uncharacterized hydrolase YugF-like isoform X2 n=1 Tax=Impatiens glandulifera TaxID=253017 RepID=UPI001FB19B0E|nr:uncharacterized hydrolase YugF-like isoform X2 [Impatiens glandulifera]
MTTVTAFSPAAVRPPMCFLNTARCPKPSRFKVSADNFPSFLPKQVEKIKDPFARKLATRIQRLPVPVSFLENPIMSSCVKPLMQEQSTPVVLLHGFDSSCLEWRYTLPLLEEAGLETWAIDILGWGFCDLERTPRCDVATKREHLYQFWKTYIRRPMLLVGPSLGAAVAIDFAVKYPEAVDSLVFLDASVYAEGTGNLAKLPKPVAYAGVYVLKRTALRFYGTSLTYNSLPFDTCLERTNVGRLHCLLPWWEDATVAFMTSGGYKVSSQIKKVKQRTLIIWGEDDRIISSKLGVRLQCELPNSKLRLVPECGHIPHLEKPTVAAKMILEFYKENQQLESSVRSANKGSLSSPFKLVRP